jgi:thiol-disulfide isomerase/thioredoxin
MARTPSTMLPLGTRLPAFDLPDPRTGLRVTDRHLDDAPATVVVFWCNHCPFVKHLEADFVSFAAEVAAAGVRVVAISSNDVEAYPQDGPDEMAALAESAGYGFPYLYDESQDLAKEFGAACTPDFYLFDGSGRLAYRGQFDDSRPGNGRSVTGHDLRAAVEQVLAGRPVDEAQFPSLGCNIKWKPGNAPDYFGP